VPPIMHAILILLCGSAYLFTIASQGGQIALVMTGCGHSEQPQRHATRGWDACFQQLLTKLSNKVILHADRTGSVTQQIQEMLILKFGKSLVRLCWGLGISEKTGSWLISCAELNMVPLGFERARSRKKDVSQKTCNMQTSLVDPIGSWNLARIAWPAPRTRPIRITTSARDCATWTELCALAASKQRSMLSTEKQGGHAFLIGKKQKGNWATSA